jgi:DNA-binding LacI/PurR family transcriptional regulator
MVTRKDVARLAKVSSATVSNVINGSKYVSPELRARVEKAIEKLSYVPNRAARSLASHKTEQVGILVPSLSNPYYGAVAEGMESVAREHGYIVSLIMAEGSTDQYISRIIERQMDGVYLSDFSFGFTPEQFRHMKDKGVRFVIAGDSLRSSVTSSTVPCSQIIVNYSEVIREIFEYLHSLGHRRVLFLSGNDPAIQEARATQYMKWRSYFGFDEDPALFVPGRPPYTTLAQDGYLDMKEVLASKTRFTAVFALNDLMAMGTMKAIREAGLAIPQDVSVIGCDNIFLSETTFPPLTTIDIPKYEIGGLAMEILLEMIAGNGYRSVELQPRLVIRDSVGQAPL